MPKYEKLKQIIKDNIRDGVWKSGEKLPTEQALCRQFNVSKITIKKAKDDLLAEGMLENLPGRKGTFVRHAQQSSASGLIGVAFDDVVDPHYATILKGIEDKLWEQKYHTILCNAYHDLDKIEAYFESLFRQNVEGVIFTPAKGADYLEDNRRILAMLAERNVPCVLVDRYIPEGSLSCVVSDNRQGAKEVTQALLEQGHRRILVMSGIACSSIADRLHGHIEALQAAGFEPDPRLQIKSNDLLLSDHSPQRDQEVERIRALIDEAGDFTACFALNPALLQATVQALRSRQSQTRTPLAVAVYDGMVSDMAGITDSVTVIKQPSYRMGWEAARMLIDMLKQPNLPAMRIMLEPEIVEERIQ